MSKQFGTLLDVGLDDILLNAWATYRLLAKYRDAAKYPANETLLVPLARHSVKSTHHPYIEVRVDDRTIGRIEFSIDLRLQLEGVVLEVRAGRIWNVMAGNCHGEGSMKCGPVTLVEKKTPLIRLPGIISLREGVAIPAGWSAIQGTSE